MDASDSVDVNNLNKLKSLFSRLFTIVSDQNASQDSRVPESPLASVNHNSMHFSLTNLKNGKTEDGSSSDMDNKNYVSNKIIGSSLQVSDNVESANHNSMHVDSTSIVDVYVSNSGNETVLGHGSWRQDCEGHEMTRELKLIPIKQVMDIYLPKEIDFIENGLEYLNRETSRTELTNYFYYLFDGEAAFGNAPQIIDDTTDTIESISNDSTHSPDCRLNNCFVTECSSIEPPRIIHDTMTTESASHNSMHAAFCAVADDIIGSLSDDTLPSDSHNSMHSLFCAVDAPCQNRIQNPSEAKRFRNEQEINYFDKELFKSFVETSCDLKDVEFCNEAHTNLQSILESLNECNSEVSPMQNDSSPTKSQNDLVIPNLSTIRLIGSSDTTEMFVQTSDAGYKKLACPYCMKLFCKLARHIETMHKSEEEVEKFAALPKNSKARRSIQDEIRIDGMMKWNTNAKVNRGQLLVSRRPNIRLNKKATDYLVCPNCTGVYTITNLRNHFATCTMNAFKGARNLKIIARKIEGRYSSEANEQLREVIPVMREDSVVHLIRYDWLLIAHGNLLCMKYNYVFQENMIRAKLRLAGRVLQELKKINSEVTDFASIYHPKRYKQVIEAIKTVGGFNPATNEFAAPSTASSVVTLFKQIGETLKCEYIEKENSDLGKKADDFLYLMESQFTSIINKRVRESQLEKRRLKDHKIPSRDDVRLLSEFLHRETQACFEKLSAEYTKENWIKLSQLTIASIIVFNRRRVGESQNILVSDFNHREFINKTSNEELFEALSEDSKKIAERFSRLKARGKKGTKNVNVLLKADIIQCIELLLHYRTRVGVLPNNRYLFALPPPLGEKRIRVVNACTVLTSASKKCGAKDPSTLRGTNLRKHFASKCMAMELNDDMVAEVAKFMGHSEIVHRENYRHNTIDREIVKIAKLLEAAQGTKDPHSDDDESDYEDSEGGDSDDDSNVHAISVPQSGKRRRESVHPTEQSKKKLCVRDSTSCIKSSLQTRTLHSKNKEKERSLPGKKREKFIPNCPFEEPPKNPSKKPPKKPSKNPSKKPPKNQSKKPPKNQSKKHPKNPSRKPPKNQSKKPSKNPSQKTTEKSIKKTPKNPSKKA